MRPPFYQFNRRDGFQNRKDDFNNRREDFNNRREDFNNRRDDFNNRREDLNRRRDDSVNRGGGQQRKISEGDPVATAKIASNIMGSFTLPSIWLLFQFLNHLSKNPKSYVTFISKFV